MSGLAFPVIFQSKASVFENFEEETRRKIARMHGNYGAMSGLGMVKQKMGTLLSLFGKAFSSEKSNDFSRRRHLSTYGNRKRVNSYNFR